MDQQEPTFEDSVAQVMKTLPPIIRAYLAKGTYTEVAKKMTTKYGLRIDQAGVLERELMLLLMGIETPPEFVQALIEEARLDQKVVNNIVRDVNEMVFIPLHDEEQKVGMSKALPQESISVTASKPPMVLPKEELSPKVPLPRLTPIGSVLSKIGIQVMLKPEKPLDSSKLLEDHEEPHIEFNKVPAAATPEADSAPAPVPPAPSRIIPANLPGTMPETPEPVIAPRPDVRFPLTPAPVESSSVPPTKSYAVDPYREPIDEK